MFNILKKIFTHFFTILTILWLTYEILNALNVYAFDKEYTYGYLLSIVTLLFIIVIVNIVWHTYNRKNYLDTEFIEHMKDRIGSMKSLDESSDKSIDNIHEYKLIHRQDYLDCAKGNFYSIRHLIGSNATNQLSDGLIYSESTEFKIPYKDIEIIAYNYETKEKLIVKSLKNIQKPTSTHIFKINFNKPISKNESFNIVYSIFLPNELKCLNSGDEVMSISLVRIKRKVHKLVFNLCLDFNPKLVKVYSLQGENHNYKLLKNTTKTEDFRITKDDFKKFKFGITWSTKPFIVHWSIEEPKAKLYILQYFK